MMPPHPTIVAEAGQSPTLAGYAFQRLMADLKANRFKPGERLRFDAMRSLYDVGVAPLREALSRLAETGMVVQIGQKGFRAASVSLEDLADVIATRRLLEVRCLRDALANPNDDWESELVAALHRFSKAARQVPQTPADRALWERHHTALHRALLAGCRSRWLKHFWSTMFDQAERYRRLAIESGIGPWDDEVDEHARIVDAVLARDAEKACALLERHIGRSANRLMQQVRQILTPAQPGGSRPSRRKPVRTDRKGAVR